MHERISSRNSTYQIDWRRRGQPWQYYDDVLAPFFWPNNMLPILIPLSRVVCSRALWLTLKMCWNFSFSFCLNAILFSLLQNWHRVRVRCRVKKINAHIKWSFFSNRHCFIPLVGCLHSVCCLLVALFVICCHRKYVLCILCALKCRQQ